MNIETKLVSQKLEKKIPTGGYIITGRGGAREVLPLRKGEAEKVLAMLKGGHKKFRGSFYAVA